MSGSFQREIPKARVNITLDIETGGVNKKKELPFKILVLGDFSHAQTPQSVATIEAHNITKTNFDVILTEIAPQLQFSIPNKIKNNNSDLNVSLQFNSIGDFHPDKIVNQVPELKSLLAMRNLLKELKMNIIDNNSFRRELEKIIKVEAELKTLHGQLNSLKKDEEI